MFKEWHGRRFVERIIHPNQTSNYKCWLELIAESKSYGNHIHLVLGTFKMQEGKLGNNWSPWNLVFNYHELQGGKEKNKKTRNKGMSSFNMHNPMIFLNK